MNHHPFVEQLTLLHVENCFNPYADRCQVHDLKNAPDLRSAVLSRILCRALENPIDELWVGRDLGYRGGRRTGLALTDDKHIAQHLMRWNIDPTIQRPTVGIEVKERTAAVIWDQLAKIDSRIFLWNVFPLHPYDHGNPFSNRQHNAKERRIGQAILADLIVLLRPARIIAIGNDASVASREVSGTISVVNVRHPSYGGQTQFQMQIAELHDLSSAAGVTT